MKSSDWSALIPAAWSSSKEVDTNFSRSDVFIDEIHNNSALTGSRNGAIINRKYLGYRIIDLEMAV